MTEEYGYKIIKEDVDDFGYRKWVLIRDVINHKNKKMEETYTVTNYLSYEEIIKLMFDRVNPKDLKG